MDQHSPNFSRFRGHEHPENCRAGTTTRVWGDYVGLTGLATAVDLRRLLEQGVMTKRAMLAMAGEKESVEEEGGIDE